MAKVKGGRKESEKQLLERVLQAEREILHTGDKIPAKPVRASAVSCYDEAQTLLARAEKAGHNERPELIAEACFYLYLAKVRGEERAKQQLERIVIERTFAPHYAAGCETGDLTDELLAGGKLSSEQINEINAAYKRYFGLFLNRVTQESPFLPPQIVPSYVLGALRFMFDSIDEKAARPDLINTITNYFEQANASPAEVLVNDNFTDFFNWTLTKGAEARRIFGLPAEAACRIGLAYLEGRELDYDRVKGALYLMYAAITGSARAILAWNVFYEAFDFMLEVREDAAAFERYTANLLHGMMLCVAARRLGIDPDREQLLTLAAGGKELEFDLFKSAAAMLQIRRDYSGPHSIVEEVQIYGEYLSDAIDKYGRDNVHLRVCGARMLEAVDLEQRMDVSQQWRIKFKIPKNVPDPLLAYTLLKEGVKMQDDDALMTLMHLQIIDYRDEHLKSALEKLTEQGYAKAAFILGNHWWCHHEESQGVFSWYCAAELGSPMGLFNGAVTSMSSDNLDRAEAYALKAVRSGIPQAFYLLYQLAVRKKTPQNRMATAYTYLRYAADFMMPDAKAELKRVRESGKYHPLPFMRDIEKIEQSAQTDETAAVFMGSLYSYGVVMPRDRFMSLYWFRHAAELGDQQSSHFLAGIYSTLWEYEDDGFITSSAKHGLDLVSQYGIGSTRRPEPDGSKISAMVRKLYSDLCQGRSVLEQQIFREAELSPLWTIFNARKDDDGTGPEVYFDPEAQFYTAGREYLDRLLNTCMFDYDHGLSADEDPQWRLDLEIIMQGNVIDPIAGEIYQRHVSAVRALTAIRGIDVPNAEAFARECRNGFNADSLVCTALVYTKTGSLHMGRSGDGEETVCDQEYFDMTQAQ